MKKAALCTILVFCLFMVTGCNRRIKEITAEDVKTNTILVKHDGSIQAATVEKFDKSYYSLSELTDFINEEIRKYNEENGEESIILASLDEKDGDAILILNYKDITHYKKFNKVEANFLSATSALNGKITIPDVFTSAKDGSYVSKKDALGNESYKVLIMNENTDVLVDGTIKYYTNGVLVNKSKIQTSAEGETIVVFKP